MSPARRDKDYLADAREAIRRILEYTEGLAYADFLGDARTQDAVIRNFQVLGDAAKGLSTEIKQAHPEVPWRQMAGIRDRTVHAYFGINLEIVWTVAREELPVVLEQIDVIRPLE